MSESTDARSLTLCAACGLPLGRRTAICPSCGSLAPLERGLARLSRLATDVGRDRDLRFRTIAWALALCPLLFIPPIAAMALAWRRPAREPAGARFDPTWITIAAIVNLVVSAGLVHRFGPDVVQLVSHTERMFSAPPSRPTNPHLQSI